MKTDVDGNVGVCLVVVHQQASGREQTRTCQTEQTRVGDASWTCTSRSSTKKSAPLEPTWPLQSSAALPSISHAAAATVERRPLSRVESGVESSRAVHAVLEYSAGGSLSFLLSSRPVCSGLKEEQAAGLFAQARRAYGNTSCRPVCS